MNGQAELVKLLTSGSTGGNNGAVEAGLSDNVDLNGGVTARVVHGTSVNLGDRHLLNIEDLTKGKISQIAREDGKSSDGRSILR